MRAAGLPIVRGVTIADEPARITDRRERAAARWARVSAGAVVAAVAVALAAMQPSPAPAAPSAVPLSGDPLEACRAAARDLGPNVSVTCILDGTAYAGLPIPQAWTHAPFGLLGPGNIPRLAARATAGRPGCTTGPGRPVVPTTTPALSATFSFPGLVPVGAVFEYASLDGADPISSSGHEVRVDRPVTTTTSLRPGTAYRWRVRATPDDAAMPGWSPWCEFAVAAGAPDLTGLDEYDLEALRVLRLDPARRYPVRLRAADRDRLLDTFGTAVAAKTALVSSDGASFTDEWVDDEPSRRTRIADAIRAQTAGRVTLTGDRWATVAIALAEEASAADDLAEEEPDLGFAGGAPYRALLSRISVQLGGPVRPRFSAWG